jgi:hypothetical protein
VVMSAGERGVRYRDEGYRPLVLFQRQIMNKLTHKHVYSETGFNDMRGLSPRNKF